ncbi:hypothetical protein [Glycomyces harbinensis]|uniref:HEAT repeat-containing protein n=1 Tax=Glycomyces harbinensis TaxID=58114 RepID=A0A1G6ZS70_9ACTN|nr:hypothetical protein [Glycomyces harbinensis]SDE05077.1 hypothetical protein SAMN05216270_111157 [Glycomyces harbinensis]
MQLTLSFGSLSAPIVAIAVARASDNPMSSFEIGACVLAGLIGIVTVQTIGARRLGRGRPSVGVLGRMGLGRRTARSECKRIDTKIKDPSDVQRDSRATIVDVKQNSEDRDRAVHDLAHGPGSDEVSRWTLRSTIQDRYLDQAHRLAMAVEYRRCSPMEASEALVLFALDCANGPFSRLEAARLIAEETQQRLAILVIATAADVDAECRLEAAIALNPLAPRDAEEALKRLATDAMVSFGVRLEAARHWALVNRTAAVEVLWQIVGSTEVPWMWRIAAAAELVVLRVRAAYKVLYEWMESRELPEEVRDHLFVTLRKLDELRTA